MRQTRGSILRLISSWLASLPPEQFFVLLTAEGLVLSLLAGFAWTRVPFAANVRLWLGVAFWFTAAAADVVGDVWKVLTA